MGQKLYLECYSGISGDMTVAALSGLMKDRTPLFRVLDHMPVEGFSYELKQVKKSGIDAWDFLVKLDAQHENHDHDMAYLHGHSHTHDHEHHHEHRGLGDIFPIIDRCEMTDTAKELAKHIFRILAKAEAKAHNVPEDQVHFHEVGAVDSIVDIVAAAVCMDSLQVDGVIVPFLCEGKGTVRCQHGILPVPVPAVTNIVQNSGLKLRMTQVEGELVTPTGAAFAAAVRTEETLPETFRILNVGIGAGKRKYECPGILRAMLIETEEKREDKICKLEANIDDSTGEQLGYVLGSLMDAGARDVHYTPVFMKKNRPGWQLNVICMEEDREKLEEIIFRETTTIGIRRQNMDRTVLRRTKKAVQTPYGEAEVKICEKDGLRKVYPEYESVTRLCKESGATFQDVFESVKHSAGETIKTV